MMWNRVLAAGAALSFLSCVSSVQAAVVVSWNFNDSDLIADVGVGTITPNFQPGGETVVYVPGTTLNAQPSVPAGNAMGIRDLQPSGGFYQTLGSFDFSLNTSGYKDLSLQLSTFGTASSVWSTTQITYSFSPDGITYAPWGQTPAGNGQFINLGPIALGSVYNNNPNMRMRFSMFPFDTVDGYIAFDNITITGTLIPEPSTLAMSLAPAMMLRRRTRS